jgi:CRISPR system Cascade subunit CasD
VTYTLLLRLCGPLQSWGTQSRFNHRDTGREPSKSGVIGLLCSALGKPRREQPDDGFPTIRELSLLRMGVRVDQPGSLLVDYHTAQDVAKADGGIKKCVLSSRHYLVDASFLVGLEGPVELLTRLDTSLRRPVWHLGLGRKSCVPSLPVRLPDANPLGPGLIQGALEQALQSIPLIRHQAGKKDDVMLVLEATRSEGTVRNDVPVCFANRQFSSRFVITKITKSEVYPSCISPDFSSMPAPETSAAM